MKPKYGLIWTKTILYYYFQILLSETIENEKVSGFILLYIVVVIRCIMCVIVMLLLCSVEGKAQLIYLHHNDGLEILYKLGSCLCIGQTVLYKITQGNYMFPINIMNNDKVW